ncbi:DUF4942 domain-containing protein [Brevundimonas vesicularis]|uniref:DUF4942 domain-containing protein n=1 Tax=Brevundimonas vesicularis TaxID=41276 RepID=UPI001571806E|nr:DUF4942 domain-containing protein [Brevundimonas vesicularis]NSX34464.1 DUF4942 domain-containing protein [Brevundimonas vesicularis]
MHTAELMLAAPIDKIDAHRMAALEAFGRAFDLVREACDHLTQAAPNEPSAAYIESSVMERIGGGRSSDRATFLAGIEKHANRVTWRHLMAVSGIERLMDRTAKEQFYRQLQDDPPPATAENCRATMQGLFADAETIFRRGIANVFSKLDRRFKSHDGFKIGSRIVLQSAFGLYGTWNHYARQDDTLRDVERTFYVLDGKQQPDRAGGICGLIDSARSGGGERPAFEVADDYFRVRVFKNGNAHVWLLRDDLIDRVNEQLAAYYGATLGAGSTAAKTGAPVARSAVDGFSFFPTPDDLAERVIEEAFMSRGQTVLEPSAGTGALAYRAAAKGAHVTAVEIQRALCVGLSESGRLGRVVNDDFMQLSPQVIGKFDRVIMNPPFDGKRDLDHVRHALGFVAPGGRLVAIMAAGVAFHEDAATTAFRDLVESAGGRISDLPAGSFASVGTNINTCLVTIPVRGA